MRRVRRLGGHWLVIVVVLCFAGIGAYVLQSSQAANNQGDLNRDGVVNLTDFSILLNHYQNPTAGRAGDTNGDALTNMVDVSILLRHYNGPATRPAYHVIYTGWYPQATLEQEYDILNRNPNVQASLRAFEYDKDHSKIKLWEQKGLRYYYTVAASDYVSFQKKPPYVPANFASEVVNRRYAEGLYIHELTALFASQNGWNWDAAAASIDWGQIHNFMMAAKASGKKVVWSEPAHGWHAIMRNPSFHHYMVNYWGPNVLVPTFATNFTNPANLVPTARAGAVEAAMRYGLPLGESIQSWYFAEWPDPSQRVATYEKSYQLMRFGNAAGASYFQIEGTYPDLNPASPYMRAINDYVGGLSNIVPPVHHTGVPAP